MFLLPQLQSPLPALVAMSLAPAAPPLTPGVLFHRPAASAFDALPFRAKTNPFNYNGSGGGGGGGGDTGSISSHQHTLSPPPSGSASARSASSSAASAASGSPDAQAAWKVHLKQQCMQRVKANRSSLVQKMRSAVEAHSPPPLNAFTAAQAASASDALSQSLRGIIEDQFLSQRNQAAAAAAAAGHRSPVAVSSRMSSAYFGDGCSADDAFSYTASDCEGGLTQDELIELLAQLEEEVRRGDDLSQAHSQQQDGSQGWGMNDAPQPTSHVPLAATAAASSSSAAAAAAASPFGFGASSAFGSPFMQQQQHQLAAAYDAEAAAQMEADLLALQEYESVQSAQRVPCPVCHDPNVSVSSGSSLGAPSCASCPRCGMRYAVSSVDEFRQHLSDACELHMHKCATAPKFMTPQYGAAGRAAASAASSSASAPSAASASLALVCEVCLTWLTLPVPSNGFASHPSSQNPAADGDDDQPMAS